MFVLGIEAATAVLGVAVVKEGVLLAERFLNIRYAHSTNLLPMIKDVLADAQIAPARLSGIAVSVGPGSFTGLRIGLATAKTLAQVLALPIVGVGTLEALAYPLATDPRSFICPVINARKNEVYAAVYASPEGSLKCVSKPAAKPPEAVAAHLTELFPEPGGQVILTGDGALAFRDLFHGRLGARAVFAPVELSLPRGAAVAGLGWRKLLANEVSDPLFLVPFYLRKAEAEIKWLEKQRTAGKG